MHFFVVDSHQHYWDPARFEYPWMTPKVGSLVRPFLPQDLEPLLSKAGVHQTIVVQAISSHDEAQWLLDLASVNDSIIGVVTWADLTSSRLGQELEQLQRAPKFRGVRHQIEDEAEDNWMVRNDILRGFKELEVRGIPYDMLVRPRHLKYLPAVREHCPGLKLVIDHLAKPAIATREFELWAREIEKASALPGVWCKLSGMSTEADWNNWTPDNFHPYVQHVLTSFGYDRVMFGSDWPVCTLAGTYQQTVDALRCVLGALSEKESEKVWGSNASSFYGLECHQSKGG